MFNFVQIGILISTCVYAAIQYYRYIDIYIYHFLKIINWNDVCYSISMFCTNILYCRGNARHRHSLYLILKAVRFLPRFFVSSVARVARPWRYVCLSVRLRTVYTSRCPSPHGHAHGPQPDWCARQSGPIIQIYRHTWYYYNTKSVLESQISLHITTQQDHGSTMKRSWQIHK